VADCEGDVVVHGLCDALLGAAGLGDIGQHFPDSDPQWRGADSRRFVSQVVALLRERGLAVANADLTVVAQSPRISPHREAMRSNIAELLGIDANRVNIKATTTEGLGFLGRTEGAAAQALALLAEGKRRWMPSSARARWRWRHRALSLAPWRVGSCAQSPRTSSSKRISASLQRAAASTCC